MILALLLVSLSISCIYASLAPRTQAAEVTLKENSLSVMQKVLNLDLSKYNVVSQENSVSLEQLGGASMDGVLFNLTSEKSRIRIFFSSVNDNLQGIYVLENTGTPYLTESPIIYNAVSSAQSFLDNYQKYTSKQIFSDL